MLEQAMQSTRVMASTVQAYRAAGLLNRPMVVEMMKGLLQAHPHYVGVSSGWEPNAFDGRDSEFANTAYHDESGRFLPYWYRDSAGKPKVEALVDYEKPGAGDYYLIPKQTRRPSLLEPYLYAVNGQEVLMTTLGTPVLEGERFLGYMGLDLPLRDLHEHVQKIRLYEEGYASLLSNQGVYVGDKDAGKLNQKLAIGEHTSAALQAIQKGQKWQQETIDPQTGEQVLRIFLPVVVEGGRRLGPLA